MVLDVKRCPKCQQTKSRFDDFYRLKKSPTAVSGWCKACICAKMRRGPVEMSCEVCGQSYQSKRPSFSRFCSDLCGNRDRARRAGKVKRVAVVDGKKKCMTCREWKSVDEFGKRADRGDAPLSYCKECNRGNVQTWAQSRKGQESRLRSTFNVSLAWYEAKLEEQGFACALCRRPTSELRNILGVDHDHTCCPTARSCGKCVRGLLCFDCNVALGKFRDDIDLLRRAIAYLSA